MPDGTTTNPETSPENTPPPAAKPAALASITSLDQPIDHAALKAAGAKTRDGFKTFGDLVRENARLQTPEMPKEYDVALLKAAIGPDEDFSDMTSAARAAKMTAGQFKAFSEAFIAEDKKAADARTAKRGEEIKAALGDVSLETVADRWQALTGEQVDLSDMPPSRLKALVGLMDRASGTKLPAPGKQDDKPAPQAEFSLTHDGTTYGIDLSGDLEARRKSIQAFHSQKVKVGDKEVRLRDVPAAKRKHHEIYTAALRKNAMAA